MATENISDFEAERWRQMSDELHGQVERLKDLQTLHRSYSRAEWQAIIAISDASRFLFSAFATILREGVNDEEAKEASTSCAPGPDYGPGGAA